VIFVDTSAWYAFMDSTSAEHHSVTSFATSAPAPLITTDYILAESLTLLRARRLDREAFELGERILFQRSIRLEWVTPEEVNQAWILFRYRDKDWSFVDCVSFAVIQRLQIRSALALDTHFLQFGSLTVYPS
jgi:predicted nucleic acid-binding protein